MRFGNILNDRCPILPLVLLFVLWGGAGSGGGRSPSVFFFVVLQRFSGGCFESRTRGFLLTAAFVTYWKTWGPQERTGV